MLFLWAVEEYPLGIVGMNNFLAVGQGYSTAMRRLEAYRVWGIIHLEEIMLVHIPSTLPQVYSSFLLVQIRSMYRKIVSNRKALEFPSSSIRCWKKIIKSLSWSIFRIKRALEILGNFWACTSKVKVLFFLCLVTTSWTFFPDYLFWEDHAK